MRLNINLASHPYEDAGNFYRRWGTALGVLVLVTLALVAVAASEWMSTRSITKQIADIHKQIDNVDDKRIQAQAILNRPEHQDTRRRSSFMNELIATKSFSWTLVLANMETLMPTRVHIVSIKPELDKESQIEVTITAAGDSWEKGVELLQNLEKSRYFREPRLKHLTDSQAGQPGSDPAKFELHAYYVPQVYVPAKEKNSHNGKPVAGRNVPPSGGSIATSASKGGG